jgi:N utilization substance protein B
MSGKSAGSRHAERVRAFQVVYSLFFSPALSEKALGKKFLRTLYAKIPTLGGVEASRVFASEKEEEDGAGEDAVLNPFVFPAGGGVEEIIVPADLSEQPEGFAWDLVRGTWQNQRELDALITKFSQNWRLDRMGKVELALLRLAAYELIYRNDVPGKVVINEAIELSKIFGDDSSRGFVNGILDALVKALDSGELGRADLPG